MKIKALLSTYKYPLILLLVSVVCYFQIALFIFIPKWDNVDAFMPYRYIVGDWIASGNFPAWNPYQLMGYPIHADPQSGAWYPVVWILSAFGGYSFLSLNVELWLHIFLAGLGTYYFSKTVGLDRKVALYAGMVFMLSGFFIGSGQLLVMFIGAAWFPFSLMYLYKSIQHPSFKHIFLLSLVNAMTVMGAYPALTVILFYIHLLVAAYLLVRTVSKKFSAISFVKVFGGVFVLTSLLSLGYVVSILEMHGYMSREEAIPYTYKYFGKVNFDARCYLTFLYPFTSISSNEFYKTDVSFINAYIGLIPLLLCLYGFYSIKSKKKWYIGGLLLFCFLYAAGSTTPFHKLFYDYVPGFDRFRHTAFFRIYILFILAVFSGWSLDFLIKSHLRIAKALKALYGALALVVVGLFLLGVLKTDYVQLKSLLPEFLKLHERVGLSIYGHFFLQGLVLIGFLVTLYILYKKGLFTLRNIFIVTVLDLFIAIQMNAPTTLYYNKLAYKYQGFIHELPNKLTNQEIDVPVRNFTDTTLAHKIQCVWVNLGDFNKQTAVDGYNPFKFKEHLNLISTAVFQKILDKPIAYFPKKLSTSMISLEKGSSDGVVENESLKGENSGKVEGFSITREGFIFDVATDQQSILFVNQNYHHNWKAFSNEGKQLQVVRTNKAFIGVVLPEQTKSVHLIYASQATFIGLLSFFGVLIVGCVLLWVERRVKLSSL